MTTDPNRANTDSATALAVAVLSQLANGAKCEELASHWAFGSEMQVSYPGRFRWSRRRHATIVASANGHVTRVWANGKRDTL